jgi:hypothetical protein
MSENALLICSWAAVVVMIVYRGGQLYWKKPEKNTDLPQLTDKLYHIYVVSSTPRLSEIRTHNVRGEMH